MSATLSPPVDPAGGAAPRPAAPAGPAASPVAPPPAARRRRRWPRLVVPYAVLLLLVLVTGVMYAIEEPSEQDRDFLSPTSGADVGASDLAGRLAARGIAVERFASTPAALVEAHRGNVTLFVPAPNLMHSYYLRMLKLMPASTTVVLVRPKARTLDRGLLPAYQVADAWAAKAVPPRCAHPAAGPAGPAAAWRGRYAGHSTLDSCYDGGLLRVRHHATTLTVVGATDPFRNDRITEHGNAALAVGLLSGARRVLWLDVHASEPGPQLDDREGLDQSPAPASLGRGSPDPDFPVPDPDGTDAGDPEVGLPPPGRDEGGGGGPSVYDLFPATAWAVLLLGAVAAVLAAAARARRLSAPVPEPLPVLVPSTETVTGRGRLYQRSRDRDAALEVLRAAARDRLTRLLDLPPGEPTETLVAVLAAQSRLPAEDIAAVLAGPPPDNDAELVAAAAALDSLIAALTRVPEGERRD